MKRTLFILFPASVGLFGCAKPPDEPLPFANLHPSVRYVGSETCTPCHKEIADAYSQSEMGRSMSKLDSSNLVEKFPQSKPVYDPVRDFYYEMIQRSGKFFQREYRLDKGGSVIHERLAEAEYVMGSGNNLRMYFDDENGMLYELPLTWYVHRQEWDLSPGYRDFENLRFSRFAGGKCISCHNSYLEESPTARNRYVPPYTLGIGCERCHGPGELHVQQALARTSESLPEAVPTIVNPARLPPQERIDVCQQCHLMGKAWVLRTMEDWFGFRPGVRLDSHRSVYFPKETLEEVVEVGDSPQRLTFSKCFTQSNGELTCITCHNPHYSIKTFTMEHYRQKCIGCHLVADFNQRGVSHQHRENDNCVSCHMNRTGTDNTLHGVSSTDHWIRVDANKSQIDWAVLRRPPDEKETVELVPFLDRNDGGEGLRKGMAYTYYLTEHDSRRHYVDSALFYLEPGVRLIQNDMQGHFRLAEARRRAGLAEEAGQSLELALSLDPDADIAMYELAKVYSLLGRTDSAIALYREAIRVKPGEPAYIEGLAVALGRKGDWEESEKMLRFAISIDSRNYLSYLHLGNILAAHRAKPADAFGYYKTALVLEPDAPELHTNLGNIHFLLGDHKKALAEYKIQTDRWPETTEAWVNMARVYSLMGQKGNARAAIRQALRISPQSKPALELLGEIEMIGG